MKRTLQDYKSVITPIWCPGCGDYGVVNAMEKALFELEIPPENIVSVSGIGCSGRLARTSSTRTPSTGRTAGPFPSRVGAKAVGPDLTVLAVGGDGDGLGIGGGHIPHAARKNVDITYLLVDNRVYGLDQGAGVADDSYRERRRRPLRSACTKTRSPRSRCSSRTTCRSSRGRRA